LEVQLYGQPVTGSTPGGSGKIRLVTMRQAFGECVFDRARRELTCRGSAVHGTPKLLALLELLIDAAPRALTKDEIHKALWPDTFTSDATLTHLVAELRSALEDDARAPRLIRTIHGYGYAFVGEIAQAIDVGQTEARAYRIILGEREIALAGGTHILGRAHDAAVCLDDPGVSRHHARIRIGSEGAVLEDLQSKNGTMLDGAPVRTPMSLADGALIVLGATALRFRVIDTLTPTTTLSQKS
jgi:DNA-binding winged helix-turn-helix (wHTH) protein